MAVADGTGAIPDIREDLSGGAQGVAGDVPPFSGAFPGRVQFFLGNGNGFVNPVSGDSFLGDKFTESPLTTPPGFVLPAGGELLFRVAGPVGVGTLETPNFTVEVKIFGGVVPTPLRVPRSSYSRTNPGRVKVWATSSPTAGLDVTGGLNLPAGPTSLVDDGAGNFFASIPVANSSVLPPWVIVTANRGSVDPTQAETQVQSDLVDIVTITQAEYDATTQTLTINAFSSDEAVPPTLTAVGFGNLASSLVVLGLAVPPPEVTVVSSAGGSDTEAVVVVASSAGPPPPNIPPVANDDPAVGSFTVAMNGSRIIDVIANDTDSDGTINPARSSLPARRPTARLSPTPTAR